MVEDLLIISDLMIHKQLLMDTKNLEQQDKKHLNNEDFDFLVTLPNTKERIKNFQIETQHE